MSTNDIATAVQAGNAELLELWEAVRRFAYGRAYRWNLAMNGLGGMVLDDYLQCAFLALVEAVESWKPAGGAFLTWYGLKLKAAFTEATGRRTERDRQDPIQSALSLDVPLTDGESGEDFTFADVLEDSAAAAEFEMVAERDFREGLRSAIFYALGTLTADQRQAVTLRYIRGFTLAQTAERMHTTKAIARATEAKALRLLRHPKNSRELRVYY